MKNLHLIQFFKASAILLFLCGSLPAQDFQAYSHSELAFSFQAGPDWWQVPRPEDDLIYELVDSESVLHVVLWYTETEQSAEKYLWKMSHMKEMTLDQKPQSVLLEKRTVWYLDVPAIEKQQKVQTILAVIDGGKSLQRPAENKLYIFQIWCPLEYYSRKAEQMKHIFSSVSILNNTSTGKE